MAGNLSSIKQRIRSIQSTRKTTDDLNHQLDEALNQFKSAYSNVTE